MSPFAASPVHLVGILALGLAAACVWTNGNPEVVPLQGGDQVFPDPARPAPPIGWSMRVAPTAMETEQLDWLRKAAELDRMASPALREAERTSCVGLSGDDRDVSPFFYVRDIADITPLVSSARSYYRPLEGVVVVLRPIEGLTARRLQGLLDCQVARAAALEYGAPEMRWCPLAVRGVSARAEVGDRGLAVRLSSDDTNAAAAAYERARTLLEQGARAIH